MRRRQLADAAKEKAMGTRPSVMVCPSNTTEPKTTLNQTWARYRRPAPTLFALAIVARTRR